LTPGVRTSEDDLSSESAAMDGATITVASSIPKSNFMIASLH
jgi:hypothetical protein